MPSEQPLLPAVDENSVMVRPGSALTAASAPAGDNNPLAMLQRLIDRGADPESLGKMMDLAERWQASEAKRLWTEAVGAFKLEITPIIKRNPVYGKERNDGTKPLHYRFAPYDDIKAATWDLERKHGILTSYTFEMNGNLMVGKMMVTVGRHTETYSLTMPIPPGTQATNATQNFGMGVTYLKRYLYTSAFDIVLTGDDTDAAHVLHNNPEADPDAPKTPPRGKRTEPPATLVSKDDVAAISAAWKDANPDCDENGKEEARRRFKHWVAHVTEREFNIGQLREWTPADVAKCREKLGIGT